MNYKILTAALVVVPSLASQAATKQRPNIIVFMADDHAAEAIGAYGGRLATLNPSPNIDRLAKEGMLFENAFCTNSISAPARANVMSGLYSQSNGVLDLYEQMDVEKQNLPIEFERMGYQTAIVGKWHLGHTPEHFTYYNVFEGWGDYFDPVAYETGSTDSLTIYKKGVAQRVHGVQHKGHSTDILTDITLKWLQEKRDKDKPFLLFETFKAPHDNFQFAPRYSHYLEDTFIPEPTSLWDDANHGSLATKGRDRGLVNFIGSSIGKRNALRNQGQHMDTNPMLSDDDYKREAYQEYLKRYLRCVKGIDDNIARIYDYLEREGLMENTIIIYTSDQGMMLGEHDYMDKRWMYEESMRIPFLIRYPKKIKAGTRSDAIINNVNIAPTLIELAGGEKPEYMQGDSFAEIIYSGKEPADWQKATYYRYWMHLGSQHYNPAHFGIRTKDFKLIFYYGKDYTDRGTYRTFWDMRTPVAWELYDLRIDPHEQNNCYSDPQYKQVIADLKSQLKELREKYGETDENYPEIDEIIQSNWK